jgi:hypothetical protein
MATKLALSSKALKTTPGSKPASNNIAITLRIRPSPGGKVFKNRTQFGGGLPGLDEPSDFLGRKPIAFSSLGIGRAFTFEFVDDLIERISLRFIGTTPGEELVPGIPLLRRTTKSSEVSFKARSESMSNAINSASAAGSDSPMMSALNLKCSCSRPFCWRS